MTFLLCFLISSNCDLIGNCILHYNTTHNTASHRVNPCCLVSFIHKICPKEKRKEQKKRMEEEMMKEEQWYGNLLEKKKERNKRGNGIQGDLLFGFSKLLFILICTGCSKSKVPKSMHCCTNGYAFIWSFIGANYSVIKYDCPKSF